MNFNEFVCSLFIFFRLIAANELGFQKIVATRTVKHVYCCGNDVAVHSYYIDVFYIASFIIYFQSERALFIRGKHYSQNILYRILQKTDFMIFE